MTHLKDSEINETLEEISRKGINWVVDNGFAWLKEIFLPTLDYAQAHLVDKTKLLAECFYVLGDLYDFLDAPKAALRSYENSIKCDSDTSGAYREMALIYASMGDYKKALEFNNISLIKEPNDEYALLDKTIIEDNLIEPPEPLFVKDDEIWQCDELLAAMEPTRALQSLGDKDGVEYCIARSRCLGSLLNLEAYLQEWEKIAQKKDIIELAYSDWFYMPEDIFESPEIWRLFLSIQNKTEPGVFVGFNSIEESGLSRVLKQKEIQQLMIKYNLYRTEKNIDGLKTLAAQYPGLPEINDEIETLST